MKRRLTPQNPDKLEMTHYPPRRGGGGQPCQLLHSPMIIGGWFPLPGRQISNKGIFITWMEKFNSACGSNKL
jgi:hypothetical protein